MRVPISVVILALWTAMLVSQAPPTKQGRKVPAKNADTRNEGPANQNPIAPTPIVVKVENPTNPVKEADEKRYRENQDAYNGRIAIYTCILAACAALQVAVFVAQLCIMHGQRKAMTWQVGVMKGQLKKMGEQVALARQTLGATFRPKLILRDMRLVGATPPEGGKEKFYFKFTLVNVGGSNAEVIASNFTFVELSPYSLPTVPAYGDEVDSFGKFPMVPGERKCCAYEIGRATGLGLNMVFGKVSPYGDPPQPRSIYGFVDYRDDTGTQRRLGFLKMYTPANNSCQTLENPDPAYEYSD